MGRCEKGGYGSEHDMFLKSINPTFLVLILKKRGANDLKYFRPISLVGSLCKWLAKVLANKLKKVLWKVLLKTQNAFIEGGGKFKCSVGGQ